MRKASSVLLGAHMSIAGGLDRAIERGLSVECTAMQIFTKNNNQWNGKPLTAGEIERFKTAWEQSPIQTVFAHDCYLINLASPDALNYRKSIKAFADEMLRAERLSLSYLVTHPGAHLGTGESKGLKRVAESLNRLHDKTPGFRLQVLLEITAGQGSSLGYRFEHLAEIISQLEQPDRVGICFDTCHAFAAGYDISSPVGYKRTMKDFDRIIGLAKLKVFHLNDSKKPLGSRVDRHEHIGKGHLGLTPFSLILNDRRFRKIPKVLETPKGPDLAEDRENLTILRSLLKG